MLRIEILKKNKKNYKYIFLLFNYSIHKSEYKWMLSENELDAFFGFSDTSEIIRRSVYASLMWTTQNSLSMYFETITAPLIQNAILPQGNTRFAVIHRCCDNIFECNDNFEHHLLSNLMNTSWKLFDNFRDGGRWRTCRGSWRNKKKTARFSRFFWNKIEKSFEKKFKN